MLSRTFLWLLFVGLTPAGPEVVEWTVHYVQEGDFADAPGHNRGPSQETEHGCAVLCHSCSCHGPTAPARRVTDAAARPQTPQRLAWPPLAQETSRARTKPLTPPPIA